MQDIVECSFFLPAVYASHFVAFFHITRAAMASDEAGEIAAPVEAGPSSAKLMGVQRDVEVGNEGIDIDRIERVYA